MMGSMKQESHAHPFELAGMGVGPYTFGGIYEMPNLSEQSASTFGNGNPYAEINSLKLKAGAGTCANCGMAISVICVVVDSNGDRWGVGSDCIDKIGEPALCSAAKVAVARRRSRKAAMRREAKRQQEHEAWLASVSTKAGSLEGETNAQRIARENQERQDAEAVKKAKQDRVAQITGKFAVPIFDGRGGFCDSIAESLRQGILPFGRGLELAKEIYAKRFGRTGSKAFETAYAEISAALEQASNLS